MQAIVDYRTADLNKLFNELKFDVGNVEQTLVDIALFYCNKIFDQKNFYRIMFQLQTMGRETSLLLHFNKLRKRNYEFLSELVQQGDKDKFREKADLIILISMIVGTLNHLVLNQDLYHKMDHRQQIMEATFTAELKIKVEEVILNTIRFFEF